MDSKKYAIAVSGLKKSYGKVKVLEGIDLLVERGTIMALLGPNGAGKTTTVKILATLLRPDAGMVLVDGYDVVADADAVRHRIGLTGQYAATDEYLSGRENLQMMGRLYHLSHADTRRRTEELLARFDLLEAADRPAKTYSGGMNRRLDLAVSLIASPPIIFLDEPTTGLDPRSRIAMWDIIRGLADGGSTILLTTQYLEEADQLANRIAVIDNGRVIAEGTADQLKDKVGKERIELGFGDAASYQKALSVITDGSRQVNGRRRQISIANDRGVTTLRAQLDKLAKAGVEVEALSLHKPTLDDVFLHLTGHQAEQQAEDEDDNK